MATSRDDQYFLTTPPMEFIRDVRDVMQDGDNLAPDALVADIVADINPLVALQKSLVVVRKLVVEALAQ